LNKTADAFNIYEIIVNKEGTVVGYQLDKRHYKKFKEEVEIEEIIRPRTAYEVVSEARNRAAKNKPEWETEDSRLS
jgi:hypothetical protein